jgi:uncharacterized membrane protein
MKVIATLLCIWCLAACGSDSDEALSLPTIDCAADAGAVPSYSNVEAFKTCTACHSSKLSGSARMDAPSDINFDSYDAAKAEAEKAVSEVHGGSMPPADSKLTLTQGAKEDLYRWGLCGTPN